MANYCEFMMKVKGSKESILSFKEVLERSDKYQSDNILAGLISYDASDIHSEYAYITGICKWSVHTSFMEGDGTYYSDSLTDKKSFPFTLTNIVKLAKELDITIEVFGEEPGMGFIEYYLITPQGVEEDICKDLDFTTRKGVIKYGAFTI